jgi:hypothetical protein
MSQGNAILTADTKSPIPPGATALGSDRDRAWIRIAWADAAALDARAAKGWSLAYLDESAYLEATVGFTPPQVRLIMEKRANEAPQTLSDFTDDLGEEAGRLAAWGRDQGGAWERNAAKLSGLQREAFFTGRFVLGTHEDISQLIRWRSGLASFDADLAAHKACPPAWAPVFAGFDGRPALELLAQAAAHLGQPAFTIAPIRDKLPRIAFTAGSPEIGERIARHELMAEIWSDAFLIPLTADEIRALHPLPAATVYPTAEDYQRSLLRLSPDQRKAEIDSRIAGGIPPKDRFASIAHLRLNFLAFLAGHREEEAASSRADAANLARLDAAFAAEADALDRMLRLAWGAPAPKAYADRVADLRVQAKILGGFAERAGQADAADLMALFAKTLAALEPV